MFKKIIAISCITAMILSQMIEATESLTAISTNSEAKDVFYQKYGVDNSADIFYNGQYIEFEDVQPLVINGTTFVPIRVFCDTLGAEITFDDASWEVGISNGDDMIKFVAGSADIDVNGTATTLSSETFILESRTMVPARLISEAFDLDVSWNGTHKQVSIVDTNALKEGIDGNYKLINGVIELASDQSITGNVKVDGDFTTINGDFGEETVISADFVSIMNSDMSRVDFDATISIDMSAIDPETYIAQQLENGDIDQATAEILAKLYEDLKEFDANIVLDIENYDVYVKTGITQSIAQMQFGTDIVDNDTVVKFSYQDILNPGEFELFENQLINVLLEGENYNLENIIDTLLAKSETTDIFDVNLYGIAEFLVTSLKDENFVESDQIYKITESFEVFGREVEYEFTINTDDDVVTSYNLDVIYGTDTSTDTALFSVSQESINQISFMMYQKILNPVFDTYEVNSMEANLEKSDTDEQPATPPTENVLDISQFIN